MKVKFQYKVLVILAMLVISIPLITTTAITFKGQNFVEIEYDIVRETRTLELELEKSEIILRSAELIILRNEVIELEKGRIEYKYLDTLGCLVIAFSEWDNIIDVTNYFALKDLDINERY